MNAATMRLPRLRGRRFRETQRTLFNKFAVPHGGLRKVVPSQPAPAGLLSLPLALHCALTTQSRPKMPPKCEMSQR